MATAWGRGPGRYGDGRRGGGRPGCAMRGAEAGAPELGGDAEQPPQPRPGALPGGGGPQESRKQWKKFLYCEPHRRIKEVLEEELFIKRDECHIKSPPAAAAALDGVWSIQRNLPVGGTKPGQSRGSSLPQAKYYSRHGSLRAAPGPRNCSGKQLLPARRAPLRPGKEMRLITEEKEADAASTGDGHKEKIHPFSTETKPLSLMSDKQRRNSDLLHNLRGVKNVY
ncbi:uncharacterized protein C11orf97 homolog [Sorex fumeus]|uniref:uncharacterized protein C11orf97 homolog n=1 Tax=Sorex fumeus TaxID=62283 RepID=UPI0024AE2D04|nr:uncharacterized protein C11orf97 homolog [Sorex fumeus]